MPAARAGQAYEAGLADAGFKGLDDRGVELVACAAELVLAAMLCGEGLAGAAAWLPRHESQPRPRPIVISPA